jgi:NADPH2:quinone reductase
MHRLPPKVTYGQGAALACMRTAYRALFYKANARPGETVLVHGATGGVGIAAVQIGKMHGMRVLATGGSERGLDVVRENGADAVFNHREDGYLQAITAATGGQGSTSSLEMAVTSTSTRIRLLTRSGRVVIIGNRGR